MVVEAATRPGIIFAERIAERISADQEQRVPVLACYEGVWAGEARSGDGGGVWGMTMAGDG